MRLFSFTTDATPKHEGEGVDWEDGTATYRLREDGGKWYNPYTGGIADVHFQFGGLPGYVMTYRDEE